MEMNASYTSLVAVGDSFTEGMSDLLPDGSYRGWADLLAARLAARTPGFRYANLAVRGKLIGQIVDEQVDAAAAMQAPMWSRWSAVSTTPCGRSATWAWCAGSWRRPWSVSRRPASSWC